MSKTVSLAVMNKAKKKLESIENSRKSWKSEFARNIAIWEDIAEELNSAQTEGDEYFWGLVMDLYHEKYREQKK